jgi:hypothetical protein
MVNNTEFFTVANTLNIYNTIVNFCLKYKYFNPFLAMRTIFIILPCLMPDNFTHQGESVATQ